VEAEMLEGRDSGPSIRSVDRIGDRDAAHGRVEEPVSAELEDVDRRLVAHPDDEPPLAALEDIGLGGQAGRGEIVGVGDVGREVEISLEAALELCQQDTRSPERGEEIEVGVMPLKCMVVKF
jgi:hypothetical protein